MVSLRPPNQTTPLPITILISVDRMIRKDNKQILDLGIRDGKLRKMLTEKAVFATFDRNTIIKILGEKTRC